MMQRWIWNMSQIMIQDQFNHSAVFWFTV